ncbi:GAP1-N1 domain-containing protein [Rhizobium laguerreae]|uniref:GAP1-N1 domain-containing protein n=1 Tax=Rhizobium laguerreae TaxID=1076926 RepID=UPI001C90F45B|nr:hypothetical protein [Rhizobium laguerreae]MBY3321638.1 hypothetical protein [Rhizobium laguerreae]MBY3363330.1 hypothetical protein [Rhizobium laguerreae]
MERSETTEIDQALFGYADGHRQLASSMKLPARDMYELASRSDLVPGARFDGYDHYLTGFSLPESRAFAFVKTWLAPEMPRPGCVWSHVLLLSRSFLSKQVDLGVLDMFFRRPDPVFDRELYTKKLQVKRFAKSAPANQALVRQMLAAYYGARHLEVEDRSPRIDLSRALLAVWSQQWPKLRSDFEFRTAITSNIPPVRGLSVRPKTGTDHTLEETANWLTLAVADATATEITPLRRFLWRYGKDILAPRETFIALVELYAATLSTTEGWSLKQVESVFDSLPGETNGTTLKRDLLGAADGPLALVPRIRSSDVVDALVHFRPLQNKTLSKADLIKSIGSYGATSIPTFALSLMSNVAVTPELDIVSDYLKETATLDELLDPRTPTDFAVEVLKQKPELIGKFDLKRLTASAAEQLLPLAQDPDAIEQFFVLLLKHSPSDVVVASMNDHPREAIKAAVSASIAESLSLGWSEVLPTMARSLFEKAGLELIGMAAVNHALRAFGFPVSIPIRAAQWWGGAIKGDKGSVQDQMIVMVFVLVRSFQEGLAGNLELATSILPQLRASVLSNTLPEPARALLDANLPRVSDYWDLNKRILKGLRRERRNGVDITPVILQLALSEAELAYVLDQRTEDGAHFNFARLFWPWR